MGHSGVAAWLTCVVIIGLENRTIGAQQLQQAIMKTAFEKQTDSAIVLRIHYIT